MRSDIIKHNIHQVQNYASVPESIDIFLDFLSLSLSLSLSHPHLMHTHTHTHTHTYHLPIPIPTQWIISYDHNARVAFYQFHHPICTY